MWYQKFRLSVESARPRLFKMSLTAVPCAVCSSALIAT